MYKLITTAAVIMTVATPSFAWDNAKDIINNLGSIYSDVGGTTQFDALQGNGGELNTFIETVNKGVTHVTLEVKGADSTNTDPDIPLNGIIVGVNQGVTLQEIIDDSDDLINRVSFDLFHEDGVAYDGTQDYGNTAPVLNDGTGANGGQNYVNADGKGLVGARITSIVEDTNTINDFLTANGTSTDDANDLIAAIGDNTYALTDPLGGVNVAEFHTEISDLNSAITTAGTTTFFDNLDTTGLTNANISNFQIQGHVAADGTVAGGYTSLLDWATRAP